MNISTLKSEKLSKIVPPISSSLAMENDTLIFEKIKLGSESAFESIFKKYYIRLCHYVFQYVQNMPDAEEIVQETFLNIWDKRLTLEINVSFKSYLYASAKNRALNSLRNTSRRKGHLSVISSYKTQKVDPSSELLVNEINDQLFLVLENLPTKCKKIFQMSRMEGLKHKEIAIEMGIKIKTVENQIGIALKYLKENLSDYLRIIVVLISTINMN